jgi:hypothetical protein
MQVCSSLNFNSLNFNPLKNRLFVSIMSTLIPLNPVELWRPKDIYNTEIENFRIKVNKKYDINLGAYPVQYHCINLFN